MENYINSRYGTQADRRSIFSFDRNTGQCAKHTLLGTVLFNRAVLRALVRKFIKFSDFRSPVYYRGASHTKCYCRKGKANSRDSHGSSRK